MGSIDHSLVQALGLTIIHSLWQGAALAAGYALLSLCLRRSSARVRYTAGLMALSIMLILSIATFASLSPSPAQHSEPTMTAPIQAAAQALPTSPSSTSLAALCSQMTPWIVTFWLVGVLLLSLRLLGGWAVTRRLRGPEGRSPAGCWRSMLALLGQRMGINKLVGFRESNKVLAPITLGLFKPIILFPLGLLSGLPPDQVEALLAHELAHILRHDYLLHLLQSVVEILYFYHPTVSWISSRVHLEREQCCDDLAAALTGRPLSVALALARAHAWRGTSPTLALSAVGRKSQVLPRIRRLLKMNQKKSPIVVGWIGLVFLSLLLGLSIVSLRASGGNTPSSQPIAVLPQESTPPPVEPVPEELAQKQALVASLRLQVEKLQSREAPLNKDEKESLQKLRQKLLREEAELKALEKKLRVPPPAAIEPTEPQPVAVPPAPPEPAAAPQPGKAVKAHTAKEVEKHRQMLELMEQARMGKIHLSEEQKRQIEFEAQAWTLQKSEEAEKLKEAEERHARDLERKVLEQRMMEEEAAIKQRLEADRLAWKQEKVRQEMEMRAQVAEEASRYRQVAKEQEKKLQEMEMRAQEMRAQELARKMEAEQKMEMRAQEKMAQMDAQIKRLEAQVAALVKTIEALKEQKEPPTKQK